MIFPVGLHYYNIYLSIHPSPGEIQGTLAAVCDALHQVTATGEVRSAQPKSAVIFTGISMGLMVIPGDLFMGKSWGNWLVVWLPFLAFSHILGIIIPIDFHIFSEGWPNHQPEKYCENHRETHREHLLNLFDQEIWVNLETCQKNDRKAMRGSFFSLAFACHCCKFFFIYVQEPREILTYVFEVWGLWREFSIKISRNIRTSYDTDVLWCLDVNMCFFCLLQTHRGCWILQDLSFQPFGSAQHAVTGYVFCFFPDPLHTKKKHNSSQSGVHRYSHRYCPRLFFIA